MDIKRHLQLLPETAERRFLVSGVDNRSEKNDTWGKYDNSLLCDYLNRFYYVCGVFRSSYDLY